MNISFLLMIHTREQLDALNEEREKFVQREFDKQMEQWKQATMKRNYISVEHRRKIIEEKRKKDEQKDDSKVYAYRSSS